MQADKQTSFLVCMLASFFNAKQGKDGEPITVVGLPPLTIGRLQDPDWIDAFLAQIYELLAKSLNVWHRKMHVRKQKSKSVHLQVCCSPANRDFLPLCN